MLTLLSAALLVLAIWIVVPAPTLWLFPLAVGAPEVSPILVGVAALLFLMMLRRLWSRKLAAVLVLAAGGIAVTPLLQLSAVERTFDREMARVFPNAARRGMPANARARPVVPRDLVLGIQTGEVRVERGLPFASPESRPLALDIYRPAASGRYPILVQIYGGAWQRGNRTDNETFARYFASRGYVVIAPEYRHAPRAKWPLPLEDVQAAIVWIRTNGATYDGDPSRMALIGRSAGAHIALLAAYAGDARAVVSYYGPTDLAKGWHEPPDPDPLDVRSILETFIGGTPETMPERYREASPITHASAAVPPTLFIHGTRDHVVLPIFSRELHAKLTELGAKSVLLEIPWAEHAFDALPNGLSGQVALYYTERFLAATLSNVR